jgi:hypothetical protein
MIGAPTEVRVTTAEFRKASYIFSVATLSGARFAVDK